MARFYKDGRERLREDGKTAFIDRTFRLLLLGSVQRPAFDEGDTTLDAVLDHDENGKAGDVALRTQVIPDPTQPFGVRSRIVQFFVEEGSRDRVRNALGPAALYESTDGEEQLIALVPKDGVVRMVSGEGFAVTIPFDPEEPEAADPAPKQPPQTEDDKDGNSVPDELEYVEGDPDKGRLQQPATQQVELVGAKQEAKAGTSSDEGRERVEAGETKKEEKSKSKKKK